MAGGSSIRLVISREVQVIVFRNHADPVVLLPTTNQVVKKKNRPMEIFHGEQAGNQFLRTSPDELRSGESMLILIAVSRIDAVRTKVLGCK